MNSLWNFDDVFALSQENEVHTGGGAANWLPETPAMPAPSRSFAAAPIHQNECLPDRQNWPELDQPSNGYLHEIANSSNTVQASVIPCEKPSHTVEFFGLDFDFVEGNQSTNQNSGPYTQAPGVGSPKLGTGSLSDILASGDAAFIPSVEESLPRSFEIGALDLNFPAVQGGWWDFNAGGTANATEKSLVSTDLRQADCLYGTPAPSQVTYDLNLTPRSQVENIHTSGVSQHRQLGPITPDLAQSGNPQLPIVYSLEDEIINQAKSSRADKSISLAKIDAANNENNVLQNIIENDVEEGIDLNRTPQQRTPKRKKHRPKVITEGKAKKTKTSQTLQKPTNVSGNPSGKRKYVRKKSLSGTPVTPQAEETGPAKEQTSGKSAKRALNFNLEKVMEARTVAGPEQTMKNAKTAEVVHQSSRSQTREPTTKTMAFFGTGGTILPEVAQQNRFLPQYQQENIISSASASTSRSFAPTYSLPELQAAVHQQGAMNGRRHGGDSGLSPVLLTNSIIGNNSPTEQQINNGVSQPMFQSKANTQNFTNSGQVLLNRSSQAASNVARDHSILNGQTPQSISTNAMWQQILSGLAENQRQTSMKRISQASPLVQDPRHNQVRGRSNDIASTVITTQMSCDMPKSYGASELNQVLRNGYLHLMALPQKQALFEQQAIMGGGSMLDLMRGVQSNPQQQLIQVEQITPARKQQNTSLSATTPVQNKQAIQSKRNAPKSPAARKGSITTKKEMALSTIDEITSQLSSLHLAGGEEGTIVPYKGDGTIVPFEGKRRKPRPKVDLEGEEGAIVPYKGDGAIVPFEGKKRKPRPKVDLDPETNRVWNLLMGKENGEGLEENNQDKEKWWENEREVFRGRADSFIARMHLVQGDRRFSRWKGSVVDSVVGVFLTQNVSDHLSSSAFIDLAARFPVKSTSSIIPCDSGMKIIVEEPEDSTNATGAFDSCTNLQHACNRSPVAVHSTRERWRDTQILVPDRNVFEMHTHCSEEEAISSEGSFDCSAVGGSGRFRSYSGSNSESEDLGVNNKSEGVRQSASRTPTPAPGEKFMLPDINFQVHGNISPNHVSESVHGELNDQIYINGSSGSTTSFAFVSRNGCTVPLPASLCHLQMFSEVQVGNYDVFGEDITSSLSKASTYGDGVAREAHGAAKQIKRPLESTGRSTIHEKRVLTSEEAQTMGHRACTKPQAQQKSCSKAGSQSGVNQPSQNLLENTTVKPSSTDLSSFTKKSKEETKAKQAKPKGAKAQADKKIDWDYLRKDVQLKSTRTERSEDTKDSMDYEAMRQASIKEISKTIEARGMNNMLAERIKDFLNRLVEDHGSIDLEWLRDVPPDKAKDYLLSIRGLGLKSVECVRLLTLHHLAFPVDTNVGRIAVRLGWVPLQPLPETLQLHLLELYPVLESVQKYLWPRLYKLDQRTLYELHYQLITFGKVFCTKKKPNCNACPMRGECRHFASAFASARLALPGPGDKSIVSSTVPVAENSNPVRINPVPLQSLENHSVKDSKSGNVSCKPIIEEPASPEQECIVQERDIEDGWGEEGDDDEIPTIKLNMEEFTENLQNFMQGNNMELQDGDTTKALVALNPRVACIPTRKLKNVSRLRTEHQVYELPDDHPLLARMIKREPDDPSPYLLAIWTPGETADSVQPPERQRCQFEDTGCLCKEKTCFSCNSIREANSQTVRGTLLIPCRTAMRGSFPLNGTYFQVNEMFADHDTSVNPIDVPRNLIWNLRRRTVYFGTSVTSIFRGLTTEEIQFCFWKGFVCVRGFEQGVWAPRPLVARLHLVESKVTRAKEKKLDKKG